ncbi:MAG: hypothetical protein D6797_09650 [Bdellovibrio sp.]|nr:MAG: hypothetical protein D6797_09650 [Bdellovibrio sp.]
MSPSSFFKKQKIIASFLFCLWLIPHFSYGANIDCKSLNFKNQAFYYYDMDDDNPKAVEGSLIFKEDTLGLIFHDTLPLAQVKFTHPQKYTLSDLSYQITENPISQRCQLTFTFQSKDDQGKISSHQESYELIALSYSGIYWFGQRNQNFSEVYFYLEKAQ